MRKIDVRKKEAKGFHKYRKNVKTLGVVQSTPPQYNRIISVIVYFKFFLVLSFLLLYFVYLY